MGSDAVHEGGPWVAVCGVEVRGRSLSGQALRVPKGGGVGVSADRYALEAMRRGGVVSEQ